MTIAVLLGVAFGAGLWLLYAGLAPAQPPLHQALARLGQPLATADQDPGSGSLDARLGGALRRRVTVVDQLIGRLRTDLRVLGRDPNEQTAQIAAYAAGGLLWAPTVTAGAALIGYRIPLALPLWLGLAGAAAAIVVAARHINQQATDARTAFSHAVSAYCDVISMEISAGYELNAAVFDAARRGGGRAFEELRDALHQGFMLGENPWDSFARLGRDLDVNDLVELASTLELAGDEGASVADTLASKAASLRERLVAETEQATASATERMSIPAAMVLIGFLAFLAYPALHFILQEAA